MKQHLYILATVITLAMNNTCSAQAADSTEIVHSLMKCWRTISHEYSAIYGLEEDEIRRYSKQHICLTKDSISMFYGVSYAPKFTVKKVNAADYAKDNFDCTKQKLGISADSVYEITILSVTKPTKTDPEHKMTDVVAYDGNCLYAVVDGVIFKMFDADVKIQARIAN